MFNIPEDKQAELIPFHAINEFMRNDYRLTVVRNVIQNLGSLPEGLQKPVNRLVKKTIQVPGFRHSDKAPAAIKIQPTADAFEKNPDLVAAILAAWAGLHSTLRSQVYTLLTNRGWEYVLPVEADRTKFPGFFIKWPKGETFEVLGEALKHDFPEVADEADDIALMIVWVSMRLPYKEEEKTELTDGKDDEIAPDALPAA
jgi:hypothetical protein